MKTVHKFPLDMGRTTRVYMPPGATILSAREQRGVICVWAEVDPHSGATEGRVFEIFGTGHDIHEGLGVSREFVDTVVMMGGDLVLHVYERTS